MDGTPCFRFEASRPEIIFQRVNELVAQVNFPAREHFVVALLAHGVILALEDKPLVKKLLSGSAITLPTFKYTNYAGGPTQICGRPPPQ